MTIVAQCNHCGKKYQVADNFAGKQVKCQACQNRFVVQTQKATVAAGAGARASAAPAAQGTTAGQQQALASKFGLSPLPPNENRVFPDRPYQRPAGQPDPLANHVVYEPGFAAVTIADYHATQMPKEQSMHDYMKQIEQEDQDDLMTSSNMSGDQKLMLFAGLTPFLLVFLTILLNVVGIFGRGGNGGAFFLFTMLCVGFFVFHGFLVYAVSQICNATQTMLFLIVPFYQFVVIANFWKELKSVALAWIVYCVCTILVIIGLVVVGMVMMSVLKEEQERIRKEKEKELEDQRRRGQVALVQPDLPGWHAPAVVS